MIRPLVACVLGVSVLGAQGPPAPAQPPVFRSGIQTVLVHATVQDADGRLIPDLQQKDFQVFDNDRPVDLTLFSSQAQAITGVMMLDMSSSMVSRFPRIRGATMAFIDALLPVDRLAIGSFGHEVSVSPLLTNDKGLLRRVAREELWPGGASAVWHGAQVAMDALSGEGGRRVVILLSDGYDTSVRLSTGKLVTSDNVEDQSIRDAFMLYVIGMEGITRPGEEGLSTRAMALASGTGGAYFMVKESDDLTAAFHRVAEELRRQYLLGFAPTERDGREHKIEVRVDRPGSKVRARKRYLAPRQTGGH